MGSGRGFVRETMGEAMTKKRMVILVSFVVGILGWHLLLPGWHAFLFFGDRHSPGQFFSCFSREISMIFVYAGQAYPDSALPFLVEDWELVIPGAVLTVLGIPGVIYIIGGVILNFISTLLEK